MTRLLVSVRDAAEAELAVLAGADVIDVKEPSRGALGAADWSTIADVARAVNGRAPVSAALGELRDWSGALPTAVASGLKFVKFGLAGYGLSTDWLTQWRRALPTLAGTSAKDETTAVSRATANRTTVSRPVGDLIEVAVVYADWNSAGAPAPWDVLAGARRLGCGAVLVDTHEKHGGSLLDLWSPETLASFVAQVHETNMLVALAGGLALEHLDQILQLMPDLIGVRGAACHGGRTGKLDSGRVGQLARIVHDFPVAPGTLVSASGA